MGSTSRNASESRNRKQNTVEDQSMKSASFSCDVGVCFWAMDGDLPKTNLDRQIPSVVKTKDWSLKCLKSRPDLALPRLLLQRLQCITFPESKLIQHARRMHSVYSYTMLYSNYTIHIMLYSVWNIRVLIFDTILVVPVLCCLPAKCSTWGGNTTCSMYLQCRRLWVSSRNMPYLGYLWLEGLYPVTSYISHPQKWFV